MSLAGFPAARLQIEDTRFLISLFKRVSSTFNISRILLMCHWGNILIKIIQIFLFSLIALQPLHSYTVINTSSMPQDNGFHLLHTELCGSKYTNSISHKDKISNLLDRVNSAVLSNMPEDCVCCNSIDINSTEIITVHYQHFIYPVNINTIRASYYDLNVKSLLANTNKSRAPPLV
jgi:hypothetical protein